MGLCSLVSLSNSEHFKCRVEEVKDNLIATVLSRGWREWVAATPFTREEAEKTKATVSKR